MMGRRCSVERYSDEHKQEMNNMIVNYKCPVCGSRAEQVEDLSDYPHSECLCGAMREMMSLAEAENDPIRR